MKIKNCYKPLSLQQREHYAEKTKKQVKINLLHGLQAKLSTTIWFVVAQFIAPRTFILYHSNIECLSFVAQTFQFVPNLTTFHENR